MTPNNCHLYSLNGFNELTAGGYTFFRPSKCQCIAGNEAPVVRWRFLDGETVSQKMGVFMDLAMDQYL